MDLADLDPDATRAETLTAALIYLMTHYARTGCPRLAVCVSRHMPWAQAACGHIQEGNVH